jgi:transcription antitermination protein NusB
MQVLYQIDLRGEADLEAIRQGLPEGPDPIEIYEPAFNLARDAWAARAAADEIATELAPTWPTPRQPPVDRAIIRLAFFEMNSGLTPIKVAINEAIEMAKSFCSEQSPPFLNGVLDKMAKRIGECKKLEEKS